MELLRSRDDPRLTLYFSEGSGPNEGRIVGSPPGTPAGDPGTTASSELAPNGVGASNYNQPILSCAETRFILAEALYHQGNTAAANAALQAGIACQADQWGMSLPTVGTLSGPVLLPEIMTQKYIALFFNMEVYNDFKRTCLPTLISNDFVDVSDMPGGSITGRRSGRPTGTCRSPTSSRPATRTIRRAAEREPCRVCCGRVSSCRPRCCSSSAWAAASPTCPLRPTGSRRAPGSGRGSRRPGTSASWRSPPTTWCWCAARKSSRR